MAPDAHGRGNEAQRVLFVVTGAGRAGAEGYEPQSAALVEAGKRVRLDAAAPGEILVVTLPPAGVPAGVA